MDLLVDINAHIDRINELRADSHMTYQQLADASKVPLATVTRILSKRTENPSYATIVALERAVGMAPSFATADPPQLTGNPNDDLLALYRHLLDKERNAHNVRLATELREYRIRAAYLKRIITILAIALAIVSIAVLTILAIDATNGNVGYIRY